LKCLRQGISASLNEKRAYNSRMSEAIAFDTHRYVKRLMEGGFDELQAETLAAEQIAFLNANLATKSDIARLEAATKSDIAKLEAATKSDIESLRKETKSDIAKLEAVTKSGIESLRKETKSDIESLRQETKSDIESLRQETKSDIESLRQETLAGIEGLRLETIAKIEASKGSLVKWMLGAMLAQTTIILAFVSIVVMLLMPST